MSGRALPHTHVTSPDARTGSKAARCAANACLRRTATLSLVVKLAFRREGNRGDLGGGCHTFSDHHEKDDLLESTRFKNLRGQ